MSNIDGAGGAIEYFNFQQDFISDFRAFLKGKIKSEKQQAFIKDIEEGITYHLNFNKWYRQRPGSQEIVRQINSVSKQSYDLWKTLSNLHTHAESFIDQGYYLRHRKPLENLLLEEGKKLFLLHLGCQEILPELELKKGRKGYSSEYHIAESIEKGMKEYGIKNYRLSSSQNSFFVRCMSEVLSQIENKHIKAQNLAKSYISHRSKNS